MVEKTENEHKVIINRAKNFVGDIYEQLFETSKVIIKIPLGSRNKGMGETFRDILEGGKLVLKYKGINTTVKHIVKDDGEEFDINLYDLEFEASRAPKK